MGAGECALGEEGVERLVCLLRVVRAGRGDGVGAIVEIGAVVEIGVSGFRVAKEFDWGR